ncbi:hypothetical protein H1C71_032443 [Ictidomys tridecemlineatus]|nr:hypothetical protein H1C71_032443 [Ictidomys tridecemlineatus]
MGPWEPRPQVGPFLPFTSQICLHPLPLKNRALAKVTTGVIQGPPLPRSPTVFRDSGQEDRPHTSVEQPFPSLTAHSVQETHPVPPALTSDRKEVMHLLLLIIYLFGETNDVKVYLEISIYIFLTDSGIPWGGGIGSCGEGQSLGAGPWQSGSSSSFCPS